MKRDYSRDEMDVRKPIVIALGILLIAGLVAMGGYYFLYVHRAKSAAGKMAELEREFAKKIMPAREKLLKMCPRDYDTSRLGEAFDEYIRAAEKGRVRIEYVRQKLVPYLLYAVQDGKFAAEEADSLTLFFKKAIRGGK